MRLHVAKHGGFDSAIRKIKTRAVVVCVKATPVGSAATVAVLDLRRGKLHGMRIAMRGEAVDGRAAGVSEAEQLGHFVEGFTGGVVASVADVLVRPGVALLGGEIEMRVTSGDHQRENGELQFAVALLALF